jgi:hypothetical protein
MHAADAVLRAGSASWRYACWMLCQYCRWCPVSSKKHEMISDAGVEERGRETSGLGIARVVRGSYCMLTGQLEVHEPGS